MRRGARISDKSVCTLPYILGQSETCQSVIDSQFGGNRFNFLTMNPGIYCQFISPLVQLNVPPAVEVNGKQDLRALYMFLSGFFGNFRFV